jgi:hypothetical protein
MNGKKPFTNVSPMCTAFAFSNQMCESPSVCAGATCSTRIVSPFQCSVTPSPNVTIGSAAAGAAGILRFITFEN